MKNIIIIFFCMFMLMFQATAQNHADVKEIEVSGIVLDSNKDPLIGANIVVKNVPGLGVITNIDGKFKIKVELYQRLIVSYIGFESQEILIKDKKTLTVIMQESKSSVLDEVVITGTGEQKKITVTGAVSSANIAHLNVSPSGNLVNALAGNVPGVLSMQSSGAPGQNTSEFWIRGISTFGAKTSALVLVDGFERDMDDISIEDIESYGSTSLVYYQEQVDKVNPLESDSDLTLPGWDASYTREELKSVVAEYNAMSEDDLWNNLQYFLEKIIPVAAECDVNMAIHEDDPCWSIFGLPRIITCEENLDRFLKLVDDKHNGITLCAGSLGCSNQNDVVKMAAKYAAMGRIHFVHMRNVQILDNGFEERAHLSSCGSLDMYAIMKALYDNGFRGYIRPDHGRMIWGETGRAGYGLYDRALGATYLNGLWEAIEKADRNK